MCGKIRSCGLRVIQFSNRRGVFSTEKKPSETCLECARVNVYLLKSNEKPMKSYLHEKKKRHVCRKSKNVTS